MMDLIKAEFEKRIEGNQWLTASTRSTPSTAREEITTSTASSTTGGPRKTEKFQQRAAVLVEQYNDYEVAPGVHVNGALTLAENIADLGGMTLAYNALQTYMQENCRLPDQDGLSPEQRFFVAWAQAWMAKSRLEYVKVQVAIDPHSPSEVRSFGPSVNMDAFYEAFGIEEGDPMWKAPEDRVTIW